MTAAGLPTAGEVQASYDEWPSPRVLVLGLGNPLLADDGAGLELLALVEDAGPWPSNVRLVDGGTWGMSLLPDVLDAERLLVLDAVRTGREPGAVVRGEDDAVPRWYARPASPHQVDLHEVLAAADLLDGMPSRLVVVGIEPALTDELHLGVTLEVAASLDVAAREAVRVLRELVVD